MRNEAPPQKNIFQCHKPIFVRTFYSTSISFSLTSSLVSVVFSHFSVSVHPNCCFACKIVRLIVFHLSNASDAAAGGTAACDPNSSACDTRADTHIHVRASVVFYSFNSNFCTKLTDVLECCCCWPSKHKMRCLCSSIIDSYTNYLKYM